VKTWHNRFNPGAFAVLLTRFLGDRQVIWIWEVSSNCSLIFIFMRKILRYPLRHPTSYG